MVLDVPRFKHFGVSPLLNQRKIMRFPKLQLSDIAYELYRYISMFCTIFERMTHFCKFLFALLDLRSLSNRIDPSKKEFSPREANSFIKGLIPLEEREKMKYQGTFP